MVYFKLVINLFIFKSAILGLKKYVYSQISTILGQIIAYLLCKLEVQDSIPEIQPH